MNNLLVAAVLIATILASPLVDNNESIDADQVLDFKSGRKDTHQIDEFFDNDQNIYCLAIGVGIIVLSLIVSIVIYKVRSRSGSFAGSLFQNIEDDP